MAGTAQDLARWTNGNADGVLSTAANWADLVGNPSSPPTTSESAIHDDAFDGSVVSGTLTGLTNIFINGWRGNLGSPGTSITYNATNVHVNSLGNLYWTCTATSFYANSTGGGKIWLGGGTITNLIKQAGASVDVGTSAVVTNFFGDGTNLSVSDNGTAITLFEQSGGIATVDREITTAGVGGGGRLIFKGTGNVITSLRTHSSGVIDWRAGATITNLYNFGGFDFSYASIPLTITNLYGPKNAPFVSKARSGVAVTVTNDFRGGTEMGGGSSGLGA